MQARTPDNPTRQNDRTTPGCGTPHTRHQPPCPPPLVIAVDIGPRLPPARRPQRNVTTVRTKIEPGVTPKITSLPVLHTSCIMVTIGSRQVDLVSPPRVMVRG